MKKRDFNVPNGMTALRIAGALCLLFIRPLCPMFFVTYTLAGFTDVLDGWTARRMGSASEFGAKLDSIADLTLYAVMLIKVFPVLWRKLPPGIWFAVAAILAMRLSAYIVAAVKYQRFASLHTYLNKLTGAAVFAVPYVISLPFSIPVCSAICAVAFIASGEELLIHLCSQTYHAGAKSIIGKGQ